MYGTPPFGCSDPPLGGDGAHGLSFPCRDARRSLSLTPVSARVRLARMLVLRVMCRLVYPSGCSTWNGSCSPRVSCCTATAAGFRSRDPSHSTNGKRRANRNPEPEPGHEGRATRAVGRKVAGAGILTEAARCGKQEQEAQTKDPATRARENATGPIPMLLDGGPNVPYNPPRDFDTATFRAVVRYMSFAEDPRSIVGIPRL